MAPHCDEPASEATSLANGKHANGAHTNGNHHSPKRIDSILQVEGTGIVDGHGNAVVLKGVSSCIS